MFNPGWRKFSWLSIKYSIIDTFSHCSSLRLSTIWRFQSVWLFLMIDNDTIALHRWENYLWIIYFGWKYSLEKPSKLWKLNEVRIWTYFYAFTRSSNIFKFIPSIFQINTASLTSLIVARTRHTMNEFGLRERKVITWH